MAFSIPTQHASLIRSDDLSDILNDEWGQLDRLEKKAKRKKKLETWLKYNLED